MALGVLAALGAVGAAVGASGALDFIGGERANQANAKESRRNRKFQEMMSSTAHQREVADLKAAGLNPILSATGGPGASTPSGSTAHFENSAKGLSKNFRDSQILKEQIKNLQITNNKTEAEIPKVKAETRESTSRTINNLENNKLINANVDSAVQNMMTLKAQEGMYTASAKQANTQNAMAELELKLLTNSEIAQYLKTLGGPVGSALSGAASAGSTLKPNFRRK